MWPSPITAHFHPDPPRRPENINVTLPFEAPALPPSINVRSLIVSLSKTIERLVYGFKGTFDLKYYDKTVAIIFGVF